jgi:hypothetical protein
MFCGRFFKILSATLLAIWFALVSVVTFLSNHSVHLTGDCGASYPEAEESTQSSGLTEVSFEEASFAPAAATPKPIAVQPIASKNLRRVISFFLKILHEVLAYFPMRLCLEE